MATQYYTKVQVDQQAGVIGQRLRALNTDLTTYVDTKSISEEERQKLAGLEGSKFLGTFLTSGDIPTEGASAGSYADVDGGPEDVVRRWIFDVESNAFVGSESEVAGETSASIKTKYEANPDTNAFSDLYKNRLDALADLAPASNIEDFLAAFNNAMAPSMEEFNPQPGGGLS